MATLDKDKVVGLLNQILEQELAGVVRYTHYSPHDIRADGALSGLLREMRC